MQATETFRMTARVLKQVLTEDEFKVRLAKHIKEELPGFPTKRRFSQVVSVGGSRSSKTYSILQLLYLEMMRRRDLDIKVWRNTKISCKKICLKDFRTIIKSDMSKFHKFKENITDGTVTYLPTGSKITFEGADSIGIVLGAGQHISFFNEVNLISKEVYDQVSQRTEELVICDYNPAANFYLERYRKDEDTVFIYSNFMHNRFCPPNSLKTLLSREPWERGSYEVVGTEIHYKGAVISSENQPPVNKKNKLAGTIDKYLWMVYGLGLGSEKPERIYKNWKPINNADFENIEFESFYGLDFGTASPTAMVEVKYNPVNNSFYLRKKMYSPMEAIDNTLDSHIKRRCPELKKGSSLIIADSAKETYIDILRSNGHNVYGAIKGPGSIASGITLLQWATIYYVEDSDLEEEYSNYSWKLDLHGNPSDEPVKKDDHLMDAIRYIITYLINWNGIKL